MTDVTPFRPHDYAYDPLFVVSGERDYRKAALIAKLTTAKFQICPIFVNMFSELAHHPRKRLIMRRAKFTPKFEDIRKKEEKRTLLSRKGMEHVSERIIGADRAKYFHCPIINIPDNSLPYLHTPVFKLQRVKMLKDSDMQKTANKKIQTQYRESYAQTIPWEPDYRIVDGGDPEILKLDFLKWEAGLPAGVHEVHLIERARMKRAWEKALPDVTDDASLEKRKNIIAAMERDEWAFREREIQDIQDLRLELLEQMLSELHENAKKRTEVKMRMFIEDKQAKKAEQLEKLRRKTERELRKLDMVHKGINQKYHIMNIIDEHVDRKSELYGPLMRHGEHPKRWHQVIDDHLASYKAQFIGVEHFNTLPRWLNQATQIKGEIKLPGTRLCIRETKWTTPVLRQLHEELKKLRQTVRRKPCTLRIKIDKTVSEATTPEIEGITDEEEETYQSIIFIQSVLRGRASQMLIYEGRDRCRELIQELRLTHSVKREDRQKINQKQRYIMMQQKKENIRLNKASTLKQHLEKVQGKVVGSLLDFLNKELRRLMDERRAHAMCLLNERDRQYAEAAEAGRRQKELRRRREHDEMFKQITKVHQDTVDLYLQDIITEDMKFASKREANIYIRNLSDKIDEANSEIDEITRPIASQEELIADLVHNFVVPEVEKQMIRKRIIEKQKQNLQEVHDTLYKQYDLLPKWSKSNVNAPSGTVGEENLVNVFEEDDLFYLYENQNATTDDLTSEMVVLDLTQDNLSSVSIVSNISYIRPKGQGSLTQLPTVEIQVGSSVSEESAASVNPAKNVESDLDLPLLPQGQLTKSTTYSNIVDDDSGSVDVNEQTEADDTGKIYEDYHHVDQEMPTHEEHTAEMYREDEKEHEGEHNETDDVSKIPKDYHQVDGEEHATKIYQENEVVMDDTNGATSTDHTSGENLREGTEPNINDVINTGDNEPFEIGIEEDPNLNTSITRESYNENNNGNVNSNINFDE